MSGKKRKSRLTGALMALLGAACALILCAVFYGTMVYQEQVMHVFLPQA